MKTNVTPKFSNSNLICFILLLSMLIGFSLLATSCTGNTDSYRFLGRDSVTTVISGPQFLDDINSFSGGASIQYINYDDDTRILRVMIFENDSLFYFKTQSEEGTVYYKLHQGGGWAK